MNISIHKLKFVLGNSTLHTDLCNQSLGTKTMHDYLSCVKSIVDELVGIGCLIPLAENVDVI